MSSFVWSQLGISPLLYFADLINAGLCFFYLLLLPALEIGVRVVLGISAAWNPDELQESPSPVLPPGDFQPFLSGEPER